MGILEFGRPDTMPLELFIGGTSPDSKSFGNSLNATFFFLQQTFNLAMDVPLRINSGSSVGAPHFSHRPRESKTGYFLSRRRTPGARPISPVPSSNIVVGSGTAATGTLTLFRTGSKVIRPVPGLMDWIDLMDSIDAPPDLPGMTLKFPLSLALT
jgi:hypothetical protein